METQVPLTTRNLHHCALSTPELASEAGSYATNLGSAGVARRKTCNQTTYSNHAKDDPRSVN
jgi:hypothetical protein